MNGGLRGSSLDKPHFPTLTEGEPLFALTLWRLQDVYPGDYTRGSTSTLGPPRPYHKGVTEVEAGEHIYIIPLGQAPEEKEEDDPPTGRVHECRELDNM